MSATTAGEELPELGYAAVDAEHGVQLQLVDTLHEAIAAGEPRDTVGALLERLLLFSDMHFGSEELRMRLHAYPRYGKHVEEHRLLLEHLRKMQARHARGEDGLALVRELGRWLAAHVGGMDRDFAEHAKVDGAGGGVSGVEGAWDDR
jgi:hemerythrin-like metal-binding protein